MSAASGSAAPAGGLLISDKDFTNTRHIAGCGKVYVSVPREPRPSRHLSDSPSLAGRRCMSTARIVCTSFEDALRLATPLSLKFEVVEIVEPGVACEPVDLEINLEWCGLDEALASVSLLLGAADAFQHERSVRAGSDIAAPGQLCEFPATAAATKWTPALIKTPGRRSRFVDWLHKFCPVTQGHLLP